MKEFIYNATACIVFPFFIYFDFKPTYDRGEISGFFIVSLSEHKKDNSILNLNDISVNIISVEM